jgi:hypothetical protein
MPFHHPQSLKARVDDLEQTLLAINCFSNLLNAAAHGNGVDVPAGDVAFLLEHLSEGSLYRVEALRVQIDTLPASIAQSVPKTERRRKTRTPKLAAVA